MRIVELRHHGKKINEIAQELGVSRAVAGKWARGVPKGGTPMPKRRRYKPVDIDPLDLDLYADVVPIPFFPDDLPRLIKDPFWSPERLWWALSQRTPAMNVFAKNLKLVNIGQLIMVVNEDTTTMGKLERVKLLSNNQVSLRISGDTVTLDAETCVQIRRSSELHELRQTSLALEDVLDGVDA